VYCTPPRSTIEPRISWLHGLGFPRAAPELEQVPRDWRKAIDQIVVGADRELARLGDERLVPRRLHELYLAQVQQAFEQGGARTFFIAARG
jgi:hypothetical protein